ncbi:ABC transporter transmembrane protein (oligopeptide) [Oceaniovalibus guishaninsula JLT2003]|uniref:ABC transporter transmembrane protein (Oligopeptide) n=1 Tax=Oceaniovalibus guishaninsula JLT2003 TaxID=1231392 RepID=K2HAK6_9RHOB|nr:ABC transporter permease [Oceaniovalibus guishaninsula]EKE44558.1 ABC transporter transmembrane protein (oligopeptide) [Oceaniovalibus guishaninsula JLT2003]
MRKLRYLGRRLAGLLGILGIASLAIFLLIEAAPGDPAQIMLGTGAQPDTVAALRAELGLDRPLPLRYLAWLGGVFTGDLGMSYTYGTPVAELIGQRLVVTLPLTAMATLLAVAVALPLGVMAAQNPNRIVDSLATAFSQIGIAVPNFWIGLLLILGVSLGLGWFPTGGFPGWRAGALPALSALVLPAIALAIPQAAVLTRVTRAAVIEVSNEDFIRTARAKGLSRRRALWRHTVPNALLPVVTMLGLQIPFLISGAVLVENVFTLPGIGTLAYQALSQRDLIVVQNVVLFFAVIVLGVNLLVDALYILLDPRLRGSG